ncbi:MAG: transcriptional repressor [Rhizobiales bacterium]|nr:transcriptional repressor [Hyphomicrobiales bacterium]MBI3674224.1 transcriptional repressor [Hyphomicrobiales bacterium]
MLFPNPQHDHAHCTADLIARAEFTCARRGSKLTHQRRDVLACVARSHAAVGAYDIIDRMAEHGTRPAPITVYRALEFLEAHGLIHKIESRNAFVACSHSHDGLPAALLICEICGTVAELDAGAVTAQLSLAAAAQGFRAAHTVIEMAGTCGACAGGA